MKKLNKSMTKFTRFLLVSLFFITGGISVSQAQMFEARLSGNQETLPVTTSGHGIITANLTGNMLVVSGSFSDLTNDFDPNIGSHIHQAFAGRNGGVFQSLTVTLDSDNRGGTYSGGDNTFMLSPAEINALMNREMYVNIHSTGFPTGEIRGQLLPASDDYYSATLFGSNEVPSYMSEGSGMLLMELSGDSLKVSGSFNNLNGDFDPMVGVTGIHLHNGMAGENGAVSIFLNATTDVDLKGGVLTVDNNAVELTAAQKEMLESRSLYANIHSIASPSGELRGQVLKMPDVALRAHLSGANENPTVLTGATGELAVELEGNTLTVSGSFQGLESDLAVNIGAHIHNAVAGRNGGVVFVLNSDLDSTMRAGVFAADSNRFTLDSAQRAMLMNRGLYVNIHTLENQGGELRGQILPQSQLFFNAAVSGSNEVDPFLSTGHGQLKAEISGDQLILSGSFNQVMGDYAASHLHINFAGSNGGVAFALNPTVDMDNLGGVYEPDSNTFTLTGGLKDTLKDRMFYVNIHTAASSSGELRGQLLHEATNYFIAPLSGTSETNPVRSGGSGAMNIEWTGNQIYLSGSFNNLESDFTGGSHIHIGFAGKNGGVLIALNPDTIAGNRAATFAVANNTFELSSGQVDTARQRMLYVNIHSTDNPGGELRGNILPLATSYFTVTAQGKNEAPANSSMGMGALKAELSGDKLIVTGGFGGLLDKYNENIGSHFHMAGPGMNGGVEFSLNPTLDSDSLGGIYEASNNSFTVDSAQQSEIRAGNFYLNIHSDSINSGEIRGQVLSELNFFPNDDAMIISPADGSTIVVKGAVDSVLMPSWTAASDPNDNALAYTWQLALDPDFMMILDSRQVGSDLFSSVTFGEIDQLLMNSGINVGDTVTLYHRAEASDGSVCTGGMEARVVLVRDSVVSVGIEELIDDRFSISVFPSPTYGQTQVKIDSDLRTSGVIRVMDMLGRVVLNKKMELVSGENQLSINLQTLESGIYFIQVEVKEKRMKAIKLIKR